MKSKRTHGNSSNEGWSIDVFYIKHYIILLLLSIFLKDFLFSLEIRFIERLARIKIAFGVKGYWLLIFTVDL
jgi:hypothetical protein